MGMIAHVRENFEDWPSAIIWPHETSPLYYVERDTYTQDQSYNTHFFR